MKERILGAAILVVLLVPALLLGGILFKIVVGLISIGATYEFIKTTTKKTPKTIYVLSSLLVLGIIFLDYITKNHMNFADFTLETYLVIGTLLLLIPCLFVRDRYGANDAVKVIGITVFLGVAFKSILALYETSIFQLLLIVFVAVTTDVFALFGGMLIGKHKLTPISPKKTIEGSLVGLLICTIITTTYYLIAIHEIRFLVIVPIIMVLSVIGQMGDLFFSLVKRENDIKDYSHLIPGHGGILDRFDSLIFISLAYTFILHIL